MGYLICFVKKGKYYFYGDDKLIKKYFNLAEKYLYNKLSISLNETIESIKEYIFKMVNK